MLKGINYWAFPPEKDGSPIDPVRAIKIAKGLGFDCIELTVEASGTISLDTTRETAERVRREAEKENVKLLTLASGLAWGVSPTDPREDVRNKAISNYRKIIEIASWLGVKSILYLPGMVSAVFIPDFKPQLYDDVDKWAREAINKLLPYAEEKGVKLAVENVWNRYLLSPAEMRAFIDSFGSPFIGSYFDVGNVMLYGHPEHWIKMLGKRILAVHLKDFRVDVGNLNGFVDLLDGDVDYPGVMRVFNEIGYEGPFTAEIVPGKVGAVEKAISSLRLIEKMREGLK